MRLCGTTLFAANFAICASLLSFLAVGIRLIDDLLLIEPLLLSLPALPFAWLLKLGADACESSTLDLLCSVSPFFTVGDDVKELHLELFVAERRVADEVPPMTEARLVNVGDSGAIPCWSVTDGDLKPLLVD